MTLFETETVRLRRFQAGDLEFLLELETDEDVMRTTGIGHTLTRERVTERLQSMLDASGKPPEVFSAENLPDATPSVWMMLRQTTFDGPELGFMLPRRLWGQGLATRATLATIRYGFELPNVTRIYATTNPTNVASQRVLAKSGMRPLHPEPSADATLATEQHVFVIEHPHSSKP